MSRRLRSPLFLLPTLLLACEAPPSSAPPPAPVATTPPMTRNDDDPNTHMKDLPDRVAKIVEHFTHEMEEAWCTSPPKPQCDDIKAFAAGRMPDRPKVPTTTVGTALAHTDEFMVLRLEPQGKELPRMAVVTILPENPDEVRQTYAYIDSIRQGKRDLSSPLHAFIEQVSWQERLSSTHERSRGLVKLGLGMGLLRQSGRNLYLLSMNVGNSAASFDPRMTESLVVFPAP